MLLRRVHHLLFFCTIYLVLVSTPICHKTPRRHCKLFKANLHSAGYLTGTQQTISEEANIRTHDFSCCFKTIVVQYQESNYILIIYKIEH